MAPENRRFDSKGRSSAPSSTNETRLRGSPRVLEALRRSLISISDL
jgi:hypothetical protein